MSRDPEFYLVQAERLVTEGQYAAAELMLRQAAELGGNNRVYVAALAALLGFQEGRGEEALTMVQEHLAVQPDDPNLLVVQGLTARNLGQSELAESSLRKAVEINSDHAYAHHSLSKVLIEQGEMGAAETHACKAFALGPDQPDYALTAIELLESAGKHDFAYEVASLGAAFCPQDMELVQKAVQGALAREEPERAWDALEESNEDLPWVLGWKATLMDHEGNREKADALLDLGRENFPDDPDFLFLEAAVLVRRQEHQPAMEVIERILEVIPTHRGALRLRADLSFSTQSNEEALQDLQSMLKLDPADEAIALELASSLYQAHRYREALDICQEWETSNDSPLPPRLLVYWVLCYASLGETQEMLQRLPEIPEELVFPAITELAAYGCANASEQTLREKLLLMLPEDGLPVAAHDPDDEEDEDEDLPTEDPVPSEPVAKQEQLPGVKLELPLVPGYHSLLGESPAYDDDDEDEEIWVEIDEETGEEYVWIDDDDDDDEDDDDL